MYSNGSERAEQRRLCNVLLIPSADRHAVPQSRSSFTITANMRRGPGSGQPCRSYFILTRAIVEGRILPPRSISEIRHLHRTPISLHSFLLGRLCAAVNPTEAYVRWKGSYHYGTQRQVFEPFAVNFAYPRASSGHFAMRPEKK